jgi:hypothetical protein
MKEICGLKTGFCLVGCSLFFLLWVQATPFAQVSSPILEVDVTELDFGEGAVSKTFVITNGGEGTLEWLLSEEEDWLSTDLTSGTLEAGLSETVTVEVDRSMTVSAGSFTSLITVTALDMNETIEVSILVPEEPVLMVSPLSLEFGSEDVIKELSIANSGWGVLEWSVAAGEVWVGMDQESGSTEPGMVDVIYVTVDRSAVDGLGSYSDLLAISSNGGDSSVPIAMEKQNHPPEHPGSSLPADGASNQSLYTTLACEGGDADIEDGDELTYDIYFSTQENLVASEESSVLICSDMKTCYCDPGTGSIVNDNTYYWKVVAKDSYGDETSGEVWSFTTEPSVNVACPALALGLGSKHYTSLRRLRDEVLANNHTGRDYIATYYRYAWNLFMVLLVHPELRMEARGLAKELYGVSECLLEDGEAFVKPELLKRVNSFLGKLSSYTTPELKKAIDAINADLSERETLQLFGIVTTDK